MIWECTVCVPPDNVCSSKAQKDMISYNVCSYKVQNFISQNAYLVKQSRPKIYAILYRLKTYGNSSISSLSKNTQTEASYEQTTTISRVLKILMQYEKWWGLRWFSWLGFYFDWVKVLAWRSSIKIPKKRWIKSKTEQRGHYKLAVAWETKKNKHDIIGHGKEMNNLSFFDRCMIWMH